uniref:MKRN2 opposite strand protein n=1 Tax=Glossina brevipalpis TaxID=37001 RepID=A0A1A9WEZ2_9MUSC
MLTATATSAAASPSVQPSSSCLIKPEKTTSLNTMTSAKTATTTTTTTTATRTTKTTITSDPGILCFHHCTVKVFCFILPHQCPQCKIELDTDPSGKAKHYNKNKNALVLNNNSNKNNNNNNSNDAYIVHETIDDAEEENEDDKDEDEDEDIDIEHKSYANESFAAQLVSSRLLPFRLPYPFIRASQYPCAIILRPTTGDFLNDYNNSTDLHIAVTTSTGCVVEFDRYGLRRHRIDNLLEWWQCLLVGDVPEPWYDYWDQILLQVCQQPDKWTVSHYHEEQHNCYTFVLTFLQALGYDKLSEAANSKTVFCERFIVPRTTTAGKYISLYRKLRDAGIYVHYTNHNKKQQQYQQQYRGTQEKTGIAVNSPYATIRNNFKSTGNNSSSTTTSVLNSVRVGGNSVTIVTGTTTTAATTIASSFPTRPYTTLCTIEE